MNKAKKTPRRPRARKSRNISGQSLPAGLHGDKLQHNFDGAVRFLLSGKHAKAERLCRKILKTNPNHSDALHILGLACCDQGRLADGAHYLRKAAGINKTFADIHSNLGSVLCDLGQYEEAIEPLCQAIEIQPDYAMAHSHLGLALRELGRYNEAISSYQQVIRIKPDFVEAHYNLALLFLTLGNVEEAIVSCRRVLKRKPDHADALYNLGIALRDAGRLDDAASAFEAALAHKPSNSMRVLYELSGLPASLINVDILAMIDEAEPEDNFSKENFESYREATRAVALDKAGRHADAWDNLVIANDRQSRRKQNKYLSGRQAREVLLAWLRNAPAPKIPNDEYGRSLSLHILGPSRSGKTTLEKLAAALDGTTRGFESRIVRDALQQAFEALDLLRTTPAIELPPAVAAQWREYYFKELEKRAGSARIFTNTNPFNIEEVFHIAATLPNSRFIFLQRDVSDICLRIYMTIYISGNAYAYDINNILEFVTWYNEMSSILAERFPQISKVIRYEDMVADPTATLRSVAELCGAVVPQDVDLQWLGDDRGCAEPYKAFIHTEP